MNKFTRQERPKFKRTSKDRLVRFTLLMLATVLFFTILHWAIGILIPLCFAALLAMLMLPLCRKLERWKFPRPLAIIICLIIIIAVLTGFGIVFSRQVILLADDLPRYKEVIGGKISKIQAFLERETKLSPEEQIDYVRTRSDSFLVNSGRYVRDLLAATTHFFATTALVLILTFFLLLFRSRFRKFILMITPPDQQDQAREIVSSSVKVTGKYLSGVIVVIGLLSVMNTVGLMIIGLEYPLFFGISVAILNIIPYVGVPIGATLPLLFALVTRDSYMTAIGVVAVYGINQFIENNFLTPKIVGDKVNLNPLATIIVLLIGAAVWGIPGMIIFLPFLGILKITLDNVERLKPYAYLIGSDPGENRIGFFGRLADRIKRKFRGWRKKS